MVNSLTIWWYFKFWYSFQFSSFSVLFTSYRLQQLLHESCPCFITAFTETEWHLFTSSSLEAEYPIQLFIYGLIIHHILGYTCSICLNKVGLSKVDIYSHKTEPLENCFYATLQLLIFLWLLSKVIARSIHMIFVIVITIKLLRPSHIHYSMTLYQFYMGFLFFF